MGAVLDGGMFRSREEISLSPSERRKSQEICQRSLVVIAAYLGSR